MMNQKLLKYNHASRQWQGNAQTTEDGESWNRYTIKNPVMAKVATVTTAG